MDFFLKKITLLFFLVPLSLLSCQSRKAPEFGDQVLSRLSQAEGSFSLLFSHNINGETHPCGCRQFPLGGFAPIKGLMHQLSMERPALYVDTGNALFPSTVTPNHVKTSLEFTAKTIAQTLQEMGLLIFVPGVQDFASGKDFLKSLGLPLRAVNYQGPDKSFKTEPIVFKKGEDAFYLLSFVRGELLQPAFQEFFSPHAESIPRAIEYLKSEHRYDPENPRHRLIVLSSGGLDFDILLAQAHPQIDWIIGGHSQSFLQRPRRVGTTQIVQTLSRNHYLGEIIFELGKTKDHDTYQLHEVHPDLAEKLSPNPFGLKMDQYLKELASIQLEEQRKMSSSWQSGIQLIPTAKSCLDCHAPQTERWMETPHAMAYATLIQAGEPYNLSCIECHSVGKNDPHGFQRFDDIIVFEKQLSTGERTQQQEEKLKEQLKALRESYWSQIREDIKDIESVRALSPKELKSYSKKWMKRDKDFSIAHNFSGVQCMNCHQQPLDHPFDFGTEKLSAAQKRLNMENNCLNCHNADQSPHWYLKDERGLAQELDRDIFAAMKASIACPLMDNESYEDDYNEELQ